MASKQPVEAPPEEPKPVAAKPVEQAPPAEEPKPTPAPRKGVDELQSNLHRQVADAQRGETAAKRDAVKLTTELTEARSHIKLLQEQGELGGDEATRLERLSTGEASLTERLTAALGVEKVLAARVLSLEYGVPETDLLVHDDPKDMKIAALEWERTHREAAPVAPAGGDPPAQEPQNPAPPSSEFDLGDGGGAGGKSIKEMSPKEFEEFRAAGRKDYYRRHPVGK